MGFGKARGKALVLDLCTKSDLLTDRNSDRSI